MRPGWDPTKLTQLVKEPTFFPRVASHSTSPLDLFLTTHPVSYTIDVQSPLGNSDHGLVEAKFPSATDVSAEICPSRKIWHYGEADWDGITSNRPISVVELERRRLATAASLSNDLEAITAWGLKNMVEFNASKTLYCTLSNKRCPSGHSVLLNNQALPRSHSFNLLGVSITENMIWHEHVSSIATAAGKKLGYLFRARKYFSPSNLLTLYKAQIRPSLEYCSHIWGAAAPTTLSILDAVQRRAIRLIASTPAEVSIVSKEEGKRTKYQELLGQLRRLLPDYAVSLLVMVIGSLGGMRNTLLSALRTMPMCRAAAHI
nr:unnamed protein product [Callosobruchus chinensis]